MIEHSTDPRAFRAFIEEHKSGVPVRLARHRLEDLADDGFAAAGRDRAALERFLKLHFDSAHADAARALLAELAAEEGRRREAEERARREAEQRKRDEAARLAELRGKIAGIGDRDTLLSLLPGAPEAAAARLQALGFLKVPSLKAGESFRDLDNGPEMVIVPAGEFWMGSKDGEGDAYEHPRHKVKIPASFAVGKYPVTVAEYMAGVKAGGCKPLEWLDKGSKYNIETGSDGRYKKLGDALKGDRFPIVGVSWDDTKAFAAWLASKTGKAYRLLSEAEWEYACRAGTESAYCFGSDESQLDLYAWYSANSGGKTHPVGEKLPNEWRLHDMHGNVWEWCEDCWNGNYLNAPANGLACLAWTRGSHKYRVLRGGSWDYDPQVLRAARRNYFNPGYRNYNIGFRVALGWQDLNR